MVDAVHPEAGGVNGAPDERMSRSSPHDSVLHCAKLVVRFATDRDLHLVTLRRERLDDRGPRRWPCHRRVAGSPSRGGITPFRLCLCNRCVKILDGGLLLRRR